MRSFLLTLNLLKRLLDLRDRTPLIVNHCGTLGKHFGSENSYNNVLETPASSHQLLMMALTLFVVFSLYCFCEFLEHSQRSSAVLGVEECLIF